MWSSSDLQGGYPTQWMLNPSSYQNMATEEVDWASLAQQWIKMKESFPAEQVPPAPPPPHLGPTSVGSGGLPLKAAALPGEADNLPSGLEGGEAPMEMDTKEEGDNLPVNTNDSPNWSSWNNWQQWGWGGSWPGPPGSGGAVPAAPNQAHGSVPPLDGGKGAASAIPGVYPYSTGSGTSTNYSADAAGTFAYNNSGGPVEQFNQQGYWMGGSAPFMRQKGDWRQEGRNAASRSAAKAVEEKSSEEEGVGQVLDAAKRKTLPAWIREGLEKMEKEKLKKEERERLAKQKEVELVRKKELELEQQEQTDPDAVPHVVHSKFDTDSEVSNDEDDVQAESEVRLKRESKLQTPPVVRKSRFEQKSHSVSQVGASPTTSIIQKRSVPEPVKIYKTKEEILQETMKKVRIVLTDILMTVTSEELTKAASETLLSMRAKAPAKQIRKTPALTSLTGKLGLGIYNSDDDSDSSDQDSDSSKHDNGIDSDEELKIRCQRRKQEFARLESDIISKIEEQEERERRQLVEDEAEADDRGDDDDDESDKRDSGVGAGTSAADHGHHEDVHQVEAKHTSAGNKRRTDIGESTKATSDAGGRSVKESPANNHSDNDGASAKVVDGSGGRSKRDRSDDSDDRDSSDSSDSSSQSNSTNSRTSHKRDKYSSSRHKSKRTRNSKERSSHKSHKKRSRSRSISRSRSRDRSRKRSYRKSSHESYSSRKDEKDRHRRDYDNDRYRDRDRERGRGGHYDRRSRTRDRDRSSSRDRKYLSDSYRYHRHSPTPPQRKHYSSSSSLKRRSSSSPESVRSSSKRSSRRDRDYEYRRD